MVLGEEVPVEEVCYSESYEPFNAELREAVVAGRGAAARRGSRVRSSHA